MSTAESQLLSCIIIAQIQWGLIPCLLCFILYCMNGDSEDRVRLSSQIRFSIIHTFIKMCIISICKYNLPQPQCCVQFDQKHLQLFMSLAGSYSKCIYTQERACVGVSMQLLWQCGILAVCFGPFVQSTGVTSSCEETSSFWGGG